jgi:hypothetical protein
VRVGYASPTLLATLTGHERKQLDGRVIWASTSSAFYQLHRVRTGATVAATSKRLKLTTPFTSASMTGTWRRTETRPRS